MMKPFLFTLSLLSTTLAVAQHGDRSAIDQTSPPPEWEIPAAPVLSPEEALETFTLQSGFRIELIASEPLIQAPVAMDIDEDGRLWVVEMQTYMPNVDGEGELLPESRVVVLEDTNGDGQMDKSTAYMEGLILPRSIRVVEGGVLIGEPPNLWFTRDTDGDGRADEKILVSDNYSHLEANPEHGTNGLLYGIDNSIHDAMSEFSGFRYIDGEWVGRPTVQRGQWGISQDDYGRHFTNNNSRHLRVDRVPNHYYPRNPNLETNAGIFTDVNPDQTVWPARITAGVNRRAQLDDDGFLKAFTAACAPLVYRGDAWPGEYYGNVFVAEPAAHFIRRTILSEDANGKITGKNAYGDQEFLYSSDERFRPVNLYNAPDGTMYVVDMYRGILQHRQFVTTYLRNQILDRELETPLDLGRIYRIVHESKKPRRAPKLSEGTSSELIRLLAHRNGWHRDTAQRLLVERRDLEAVPLLREYAFDHRNDVARIHALWTLDGIGALTAANVLKAMSDPEPQVRVHALRMAEPLLAEASNREIIARVAQLLSDSSPLVRQQAVFSLGELPPSSTKDELLFGALQLHARQPFIVEGAVSGLANRELKMIENILASSIWREEKEGRAQTLELLAAAVMREGVPQKINKLIALALTESNFTWQNLALLKGIEDSKITELTERPLALDLEIANPQFAERAEIVLAKLDWPREDAAELPPELQLLADSGASQYALHCSACHGPSGGGLPGLGKSMIGNEWVLGAEENLIRILLNGKEGEENLMPPLTGISDENIAAILSHIRRSWSNDADFVLPEKVKAVRENNDRTQPWTDADLRAAPTN